MTKVQKTLNVNTKVLSNITELDLAIYKNDNTS